VFAMVAGGALVATAVSAATGSTATAVIAFVVATGMLLVLVRPALMGYTERLGAPTIGVAALVGRHAEVTRAVSRTEGEVRLGGEIWTARAASPGHVLEVGSTVEVTAISGASVLVAAHQPDPATRPGVTQPTDGPES